MRQKFTKAIGLVREVYDEFAKDLDGPTEMDEQIKTVTNSIHNNEAEVSVEGHMVAMLGALIQNMDKVLTPIIMWEMVNPKKKESP